MIKCDVRLYLDELLRRRKEIENDRDGADREAVNTVCAQIGIRILSQKSQQTVYLLDNFPHCPTLMFSIHTNYWGIIQKYPSLMTSLVMEPCSILKSQQNDEAGLTFHDMPEEIVCKASDFLGFVHQSQEKAPEKDTLPLNVISLNNTRIKRLSSFGKYKKENLPELILIEQ